MTSKNVPSIDGFHRYIRALSSRAVWEILTKPSIQRGTGRGRPGRFLPFFAVCSPTIGFLAVPFPPHTPVTQGCMDQRGEQGIHRGTTPFLPMALTDLVCRKAACPPGKTRTRLTDGGGLYLEVSPPGSKRWFWKYYFDGKEKPRVRQLQRSWSAKVVVSLKDCSRRARKGAARSIEPESIRAARRTRRPRGVVRQRRSRRSRSSSTP